MSLKITNETKNIALGAALRPGDNYRAAAYGTLYNSFWALMIGALSIKSVFVIPTDKSIKIVHLGSWDVNKVEDVFEVPYSALSKVKYKKGLFRVHRVRFKVDKSTYILTFNASNIKRCPGHKENVQIIIQMFKDIQKAQKVKKAS